MSADPKVLRLNNEVYFIINGTQGGISPTETSTSLGKGREYLHFQFPNEFEYYACALELIDSNNKTVSFFSFPVMPDAIEEVKYSNITIKETNGGVVVNGNPRFKPFDIEIMGDFGRKFRRVLNNSVSVQNSGDAQENSIPVETRKMFDSDYKTGYGAVKMLDEILEKSKSSDDNYMPYRLFFHNFSFNSHHMVEPVSNRSFQNKEKNMIWCYALRFKAVAPAQVVYPGNFKGRMEDLLGFKNLNKKSDVKADQIKNLLENDKKSRIYSQIKQIVLQQARNVALNGTKALPNFSSAIQIIKRQVSNPNDIYNFVPKTNVGASILKRL
jgi:hypothetical protein